MLNNDEYRENLELFKVLTKGSLPLVEINFGLQDVIDIIVPAMGIIPSPSGEAFRRGV
jgi:hypothetical protein